MNDGKQSFSLAPVIYIFILHTSCAAFLIISALSLISTNTLERLVFRIVLDSSVFSGRGDVLFPPCQRTEGQNVYFYVLLSSLYFPILLNLINYAQLI